MGRMYFPGEKAREYLPPRKSHGDIVAKFGAWLTGEGAEIVAYLVCAIPAIRGLWDLLKWLLGNFQESFFIGFFSIFGAMFMIGLAMIPLYILYIVVYAAAWVLGWMCYNKWTLLAGLLLVVFFFLLSRGGLSAKCVPDHKSMEELQFEPGYAPPTTTYEDSRTQPGPQRWPKPKDWFVKECNTMERNVQYYASGGYRYDESLANYVGALINALRNQLSQNDINGVGRVYKELKQKYNSFANGCQWQANMRHPRYNHVVSSQTPNRWNAENGWEFVNPGTSDLTVRRKPVQIRCTACRGSGYVVQKARCYSCNGRGRVPNPAASVGQAFNDAGRMLGRGRGGRFVPRIPQVPSEIRCPSCNGAGNLQQRVVCDRCSGTGSVYR